MEEKKRLPLGVQDFAKLKEDDFLYIDKTDLIYDLVHNNQAVFLSRPRRFGKSLLLSTIKYYFLGKKELFRGLAIEKLEEESKEPWAEYPVLYFDFNGQNYGLFDGLDTILENHLKNWEQLYGVTDIIDSPSIRFENIIKAAFEKTGKRVVVLIDEYDKPLLETMIIHSDIEEKNRATFKGVFGVLKKMDAYLQFYMFTGVTKFSKVSIFSDLNQLTDISLSEKYSTICGISQDELQTSFSPYIDSIANRFQLTHEQCYDELKQMYDGYHFCGEGEGLYNPYSLLHAFDENKFGAYWFESGTPTFLIAKLKTSKVDVRLFLNEIKISEVQLKDYRPENPDPTPLFYQSGYLTIKSYNLRQNSYKLGFPNNEVKYGFLESLAPSYLNVEDKPSPVKIDILDDAVEAGDTEGIKNWFRALFAILPYPTGNAEIIDTTTEQNFQNVIFMALTLLGKYVHTEVHSAKGRADCILETDDYVYIFEFKRDIPASQALEQIKSQGYATPYAADKRKLFKIGVNFSSAERNITEWVVE